MRSHKIRVFIPAVHHAGNGHFGLVPNFSRSSVVMVTKIDPTCLALHSLMRMGFDHEDYRVPAAFMETWRQER